MAKMTVLHEMVHVKLAPYLGHGKKFQDEMKRLAEMNAFKGMW
jgi:predicted metal-dependent hydrolase